MELDTNKQYNSLGQVVLNALRVTGHGYDSNMYLEDSGIDMSYIEGNIVYDTMGRQTDSWSCVSQFATYNYNYIMRVQHLFDCSEEYASKDNVYEFCKIAVISHNQTQAFDGFGRALNTKTVSLSEDGNMSTTTEYDSNISYRADGKRQSANVSSVTVAHLKTETAEESDTRPYADYNALMTGSHWVSSLDNAGDSAGASAGLLQTAVNTYNSFGWGGDTETFHKDGVTNYKYDSHGNVDQKLTESNSNYTTSVDAPQFTSLGDQILSGVLLAAALAASIVSLGTSIGIYAAIAIKTAALFAINLARAAVNGTPLTSGNLWKIAGESFASAAGGEFGKGNLKDIVGLGDDSAAMANSTALEDLIVNTSEAMVISTATSAATNLINKTWDSSLYAESLLSGLTANAGDLAGKLAGTDKELEKVLKSLIVSSLNTASANLSGVSGDQLLAVAAMSGLSASLSSKSPEDTPQTEKFDIKSLERAFTGALVGVALANIIKNNVSGFNGQVLTSAIIQTGISMLKSKGAADENKALNNMNSLQNSVQNGLNSPALKSIFGDFINSAENNIIKIANNDMLGLTALAIGLAQGQRDIANRQAQVTPYSVKIGPGSASAEDQLKNISDQNKSEYYYQQSVIDLSSEISGSLGAQISSSDNSTTQKLVPQLAISVNNNELSNSNQNNTNITMNYVSESEKSNKSGYVGFKLTGNFDLSTSAGFLTGLNSIGFATNESVLAGYSDSKLLADAKQQYKPDQVIGVTNGEINMVLGIKDNQIVFAITKTSTGEDAVIKDINFETKDNKVVGMKANIEINGVKQTLQVLTSASSEFHSVVGETLNRASELSQDVKSSIAGAASVAVIKDDTGGNTRQVYMDSSGNALASEHIHSDGSSTLLVYDKKPEEGLIGSGNIYEKSSDSKTYGKDAARNFTIKEDSGRVLYTEKQIKTGNIVRQISTNKQTGQKEFIFTVNEDGKKQLVVFGNPSTTALSAWENKYQVQGKEVVSYNTMKQPEKSKLNSNSPVTDRKDIAKVAISVVKMQNVINQAKLAQLFEARNWSFDGEAIRFNSPISINGQDVKGIQVDADGLKIAGDGCLIIKGKMLVQDGDHLVASGPDIMTCFSDSSFAKEILSGTAQDGQELPKGSQLVVVIDGKKTAAYVIDSNQAQVGDSIALDRNKINHAFNGLNILNKDGSISGPMQAIKKSLQLGAGEALKPVRNFFNIYPNTVPGPLSENTGKESLKDYPMLKLVSYVAPEVVKQAFELGVPRLINDLLQGALVGDFVKDQSGVSIVGQIVASLLPVLGNAANIRDFAASMMNLVQDKLSLDSWWKLGVNSLGILPIIGEVKFLPKIVKNADKIAEALVELASKSEEVARVLKTIESKFGKIEEAFAKVKSSFMSSLGTVEKTGAEVKPAMNLTEGGAKDANTIRSGSLPNGRNPSELVTRPDPELLSKETESSKSLSTTDGSGLNKPAESAGSFEKQRRMVEERFDRASQIGAAGRAETTAGREDTGILRSGADVNKTGVQSFSGGIRAGEKALNAIVKYRKGIENLSDSYSLYQLTKVASGISPDGASTADKMLTSGLTLGVFGIYGVLAMMFGSVDDNNGSNYISNSTTASAILGAAGLSNIHNSNVALTNTPIMNAAQTFINTGLNLFLPSSLSANISSIVNRAISDFSVIPEALIGNPILKNAGSPMTKFGDDNRALNIMMQPTTYAFEGLDNMLVAPLEASEGLAAKITGSKASPANGTQNNLSISQKAMLPTTLLANVIPSSVTDLTGPINKSVRNVTDTTLSIPAKIEDRITNTVKTVSNSESVNNCITNANEMQQKINETGNLNLKLTIAGGIGFSFLQGDMIDRQDAIVFPKKGEAVLWISGMFTTKYKSDQNKAVINEYNKISAVRIENNTHGIGDIIQVIGHELGFVDITAVRAADAMRQGIKEKGEIYVIAFSQGAATFESGVKLLTPEERKHVHYQGFGGESYIDADKLGIAEATNFRVASDIVPRLGNDIRDSALNAIKSAVNLPGCIQTIFEESRSEKNWIVVSQTGGGSHVFSNKDTKHGYVDFVEKQWDPQYIIERSLFEDFFGLNKRGKR